MQQKKRSQILSFSGFGSAFFRFDPIFSEIIRAGDVEVPGLYIDRLPKCSKGQTPERKNPFYDGAACRAAKEFRHPAVSKDTLRPRRQQKGMFQRRKVPGGSAPFFKVPVSVTAGAGTYVLTGQGTPFSPSLTLSPLYPQNLPAGKGTFLFPAGKVFHIFTKGMLKT